MDCSLLCEFLATYIAFKLNDDSGSIHMIWIIVSNKMSLP